MCVIGDFNFPSIDWTDNYNVSTLGSGGGNLFRNTMLEFGHTQINDVISNSAGNILDLVFTNITELISPISEFPCIFSTDHDVLNFSLFMPKPLNKIKERLVYNYKHSQWDVLRSKIANADLCAMIGNTTDVNEAWDEWAYLSSLYLPRFPESRWRQIILTHGLTAKCATLATSKWQHGVEISALPNLMIGPIIKSCEKHWKKNEA